MSVQAFFVKLRARNLGYVLKRLRTELSVLKRLRTELSVLNKEMFVEESRCSRIEDSKTALDAYLNMACPGGLCDKIDSKEMEIEQMKKRLRLNKKMCYRLCF